MLSRKFPFIYWLSTVCGLALIFWSFSSFSVIGSWAYLSGFIGFLLIISKYAAIRDDEQTPVWIEGLAITGAFYLILEIGFYTLILSGVISRPALSEFNERGVPVVPYFNAPCAKFDPVSGYRWSNSNEWRTMKIANAKLIFNNTFRPNKQGYISAADYSYAKADSSVKRYIVFGDSYTAAYYLQDTWVDRLNEMIPGSEFYSFAVNGGGIANWYKIFFEEVVPNYDFDAVILAVFANDLERPYCIMHHEQNQFGFGWVDELPTSFSDFAENTWPVLDKLPNILTDAELDAKLDRLTNEGFIIPDLYFLTWVSSRIQTMFSMNDFREETSGLMTRFITGEIDQIRDLDDVAACYPDARWQELNRILVYCSLRDLEVILISVPEYRGLVHRNSGYECLIDRHLQLIAQDRKASFISGYKLFDTLNPDEYNGLYLPYDGHWNQSGSDRFADKLGDIIIDN